MSRIVLIDGHSILNRAFFGVPDLTNSEGIHTNAVYGFLNILFSILEEEKPEYLTVAFDVHAPTFRHEMFAEYKGTRSPMAPELREQVILIQDVLTSMGVQICRLPGFEADDVLGTIAKKCQAEGLEVSLVSGDRDLLQISDEHIKIRIPRTKGGKTSIDDFYPDDVVREYGVTPEVFIDMKALMGDSSDNVSGVHGVGPKSAAKLLTEYGSLDGIYAHLDDMKQSAQKNNLIADRDTVALAKKLVTIRTDAPVDFSIEKARIGNFFNEISYPFFKKLEFKNYLARFDASSATVAIDESAVFKVTEDLAEADLYLNGFIKKAETATEADPFVFAFDIIIDETVGSVQLLTISDNTAEVMSVKAGGFITGDYLLNALKKILNAEHTCPVLFDSKNKYAFLNVEGLCDKCFDMLIGAYLLDPLKSEYDAEYVSSLYCNEIIPGREQILGKNVVCYKTYTDRQDEVIRFLSFEVRTLIGAFPVIRDKLIETGMYELFKKIEMPLTEVLASMEQTGIRIRRETLADYSGKLELRMTELSSLIYEEAGEEFNILSPKQLGTILFEKMNLPGGKKTKTGYSTSADVLEKMKDVPLVAHILEYRAVSKLKATYADGLVPYIDDTDRIHTTFKQTVTATGRISSADPNLQNIPTRTELGKGLRAAFIPADGCVFADADYSQIELRLLAHISGDEQLIEAYRDGKDIHRITASRVFGLPLEEVTDDLRRRAKAVNFGIVYGISSFGLSQDIGISRKEAAEYIEQYFKTFPGIKKYLDTSVENAKKNGYSLTMYGRRRPIPELNSSNFMQRQFGERVAMNAPIQGSAADIMKIAMINVYRRLKSTGCRSRIVLQIHDELLIETVADEVSQVTEILSEEMKNAADLSVALETDLHTGSNWLEAK